MEATEQLVDEHRRIRGLLDRCTQSRGGARAQLAREAIVDLRRHFRLEELVFYPVLSRLRDAAARAAVHEALQQHHNLEAMLSELEALEPDDAGFAACISRLAAALEAHVGHEEQAVFGAAAGLLAPRRREKLASQLRSQLRQASLTQRSLEKT